LVLVDWPTLSCWIKKNVQTVLPVITPLLAASETAIRTRFGKSPFDELLGISIMMRNQRLDNRSYRICGSLVKLTVTPPVRGVIALEKKP
jgi:hypothetical protein